MCEVPSGDQKEWCRTLVEVGAGFTMSSGGLGVVLMEVVFVGSRIYKRAYTRLELRAEVQGDGWCVGVVLSVRVVVRSGGGLSHVRQPDAQYLTAAVTRWQAGCRLD